MTDKLATMLSHNGSTKKNPPRINLKQKFSELICNVFGHNWHYKDYSNWIKENGDRYEFNASRNCSICDRNEYLYSKWKYEGKKSPYDVESDSRSLRKLPNIK